MQEKQTDKVIIYATRSAHGDWQEDDGVRSIRVYLTIMSNLHSGFLVQNTIRLRITGGGYSVCERCVCILTHILLSGTSITVMSHCDIHHQCARRKLLSSPRGKIT